MQERGLSNEGERAAVAGAISGAIHVHMMAEAYGIPVILHTDHAAKKLLPWIDALLDAGEAHYKTHGKPRFFFSHARFVRRATRRECGDL